MKAILILSIGSLCLCSGVRADDSLAAVLRERESTLEEIVRQIHAEVEHGQSSPTALAEARINLLRFRIESSNDLPKKKEYQREIVETLNEAYATMQRLAEEGRRTSKELLYAKEKLLAEKQRLLEMK